MVGNARQCGIVSGFLSAVSLGVLAQSIGGGGGDGGLSVAGIIATGSDSINAALSCGGSGGSGRVRPPRSGRDGRN